MFRSLHGWRPNRAETRESARVADRNQGRIMSDTVEHAGRKWTQQPWRFIQWKANPIEQVPGTQARLADVLGITTRTPHRWSQRDGFDAAVMKSAIGAVKADLPRLLEVSPK